MGGESQGFLLLNLSQCHSTCSYSQLWSPVAPNFRKDYGERLQTGSLRRISPHALPQFLPNRLVCREVAYQTVAGGINKELKAAQKKVWPTFPIQVDMFTLLDFCHYKVEVATLEDVKLVDIEFKKHDPHKIVENHLAQFNMKRYIHENSPYDEMFRGVRSYEEVQSRFQTLPPDQKSWFPQLSETQVE
jgi:hypothetical protein